MNETSWGESVGWEAEYDAVNKAAEEFVFGRWRAGMENADGSNDAALQYRDTTWPQRKPCPPVYLPPTWIKDVWLCGLLVILFLFLLLWFGSSFGADPTLSILCALLWSLLWWAVFSSAKKTAARKSIPHYTWQKVRQTRLAVTMQFNDAAVAVNARLNGAKRAQKAEEIARIQARELQESMEREAALEREEAMRRPQPVFDCTHQEAEALAARWMRYLGEEDAVVSQATRDGGIDVVSNRFVAEVKHHAMPVGPLYVRAIVGVAYNLGKSPVFFSLNGYTRDAEEFGRQAGALLFVYNPERGTLHGVTKASRTAIREGLASVLEH
ncbi:restriction endonuclease [Paeniglutamicibacter kerguelensis]|uniref:Restriction endonuclease type IV Mrr domain-containing protein n=1 Tax=Paeniglutamicibacter kerguelensis TaxID=254788 RepID=A0ABS4XJA2_9MICC|nr:restriction endonuclease [Paeniglutamicibacter kerguelensis]MBP2388347.1 hypothetical protein [Paeniglutamicibacter kerguelensis]MBP2388358.1 hypothetical protein [Paeniglutamicibacter kerguelensis]